MTDYRRLISYIYEYEGKQKGKNVGFAKLEARNGQCRIQVNVKRIYMGGNAIGAYLLGTGGCEAFLGTVFVRNGNGEFRVNVDAKNVEGTGKGLDTYFGLSVHDVKSSWRCYKTIWEDALAAEDGNTAENPVLSVPKFTAEMLPGPEKELSSQAVSNIVKEIEAEIAKEEDRREHENDRTEEEKQADVSAAEKKPELPETMTVFEESREEGESADQTGQEKAASEPESLKVKKEETKLERAEVPEQAEHPEPAQETVPLKESKHAEMPREEEPDRNSQAEKPEVQKESSQTQTSERSVQQPSTARASGRTVSNHASPLVSPELENPEVLRYLQETEDLAADPEKLWTELKKTYPKIQPFEYEDGCDILTIRPQDIGKLPRESWVYGNNSFLLHGYYNFRYLILVKLGGNKKKARYLLGVPGHYYSSEKYMATMFGFPNFVLSKRQPVGDGRFGYWYTDLRIR